MIRWCGWALTEYVAIDNQSSALSSSVFDELLIIETLLAKDDAIAPSTLMNKLTQKKMECWREEMDCIFIISALEDAVITALTAETVSILKKTDESMVINIVIEPESAQPTFQQYIFKIKSISDCVIISSASQVHRQIAEEQQTGNLSWYWPYQYRAVCNMTYGIVGPLFYRSFISVGFDEISSILQSGRDIKAVYVSAVGEDRAQQVSQKALCALQQEGWSLTNSNIVAFMGNALATQQDEMTLNEFDQIANILLQDLREYTNDKVTMTFNQVMESDALDLFLLIVKAAET